MASLSQSKYSTACLLHHHNVYVCEGGEGGGGGGYLVSAKKTGHWLTVCQAKGSLYMLMNKYL